MHLHHSNPPLKTGLHVGAWLLALHLTLALLAFVFLRGGASGALMVLVGPLAYALQALGLQLGSLHSQLPLAVIIAMVLAAEWLLAFGVGLLLGKLTHPR